MSYENQVIGTFLTGQALQYVDILNEDDFLYFPKTFREIKRCAISNLKVNPVDVAKVSELKIHELMELVAESFPSMFESNLEGLRKEAAERKLRKILSQPVSGPVTENIDTLIIKLQHIQIYSQRGSIGTGELVHKYKEHLEERIKNKGNEMYVGLPNLDKVLAGLHKKELTIIGARPSVGKTILGLQIAEQVAKRGFKVLFISLEMADTQLMERLIVKYSGIASERIRLGNLDQWDLQDIDRAGKEIALREFTITTDIRTIGELRSQIIMNRPELVVIDYLGLLRDSSEKWNGNRWQEIASVTRKLKLMTLDFDIPIVALAQLARDAENRRPTIADLRDSGELEQASDNVIMLHAMGAIEAEKEGVYGSVIDVKRMIDEGNTPTLILVEKQRNGATPIIRATLQGKKLSFVEIAAEME